MGLRALRDGIFQSYLLIVSKKLKIIRFFPFFFCFFLFQDTFHILPHTKDFKCIKKKVSGCKGRISITLKQCESRKVEIVFPSICTPSLHHSPISALRKHTSSVNCCQSIEKHIGDLNLSCINLDPDRFLSWELLFSLPSPMKYALKHEQPIGDSIIHLCTFWEEFIWAY